MFPTLEDIVLADDRRHMTALRPYLVPDFVSDAARFILAHPGHVLIVTGFMILRANAPETDGPPGAAALGTALASLGYDVSFVTDRFSRQVVEAVTGGPIVEFPVAGPAVSDAFARELIAETRPSLVIAIERPGLTGDDSYRNHAGEDLTEFNARMDCLFHHATATVGIGDGGNEIGMGKLCDRIRAIDGLPGNPSVTPADKLVVASCCNWGAFGVIAALSHLKGRDLLPTVERGHELVVKAVEAGAVEGFSGERKDWVDGRSPAEDAACLRDLQAWLSREGLLAAAR